MPNVGMLRGRLLVVAFEGWNDAGEAASGAVSMLKDLLDLYPIAEIDAERYFDYQFNRPTVAQDDDGNRLLVWPTVVTYGPTSVLAQRSPEVGNAASGAIGGNASNIYLLLGTEPSRNWKSFTAEIMATITENQITGVVFLGAMLGGAFVVETIFAWPGVGRTVVEAVFSRDFPVVQAGVLFTSILFVISNLLVDLSYGLFDPRVRMD